MTFTDIIAEVRDQCRVPTTETKTTFIRRQINLAMDEISRYRPWWWMEVRLTLTLVTGTYIALPSRFTCMDKRTMRTQSNPLEYVDFSEIEKADPDLSESGTPTHFSVIAGQFAFLPKIAQAFIDVSGNAIYCRHFQTLKLLATNGTQTPSLHGDTQSPDPPLDLHEAVILGANYRVLRFDGVPRWREVRADFRDFLKEAEPRGPTIGAPGPTQDGGFSYIVGA